MLTAFYVPSKQNPADAPTRPAKEWRALEALRDAGFQRVEWAWPPDMPGAGSDPRPSSGQRKRWGRPANQTHSERNVFATRLIISIPDNK